MAIHRSLLIPANYLKIIARSFSRNRSFAILNLLGLSVGFAVFVFAAVYVYFETHFESFHHNASRIYRATYQYSPPGDYQTHWARVPFDYINELPKEIPGVKTLIRFQNHARKYVRIGEDKFRPANTYVTDKEVFDVFDFKLVAGNPDRALAEPHSVVISQSLAEKYFGNQNPIGKEVFVIGDLDSAETLHHVTGVMKDLPANTHLPVDMLISFRDNSERSGWAYTYILLDPSAKISDIQQKMPAFVKKYSDEQSAKSDAIIFQPLHSIHLESNLAREIIPNGKLFYVRVVGIAGMLILIVAAINFMNLSSAMALGRAKEVGMRKVMGASRWQLVQYLMTESVVNYIVALAIGAGGAYLMFPWFQSFITIQFLPDIRWFAAAMTIVAVILGVISAVYPVALLTTLKPAVVLKTTKALTVFGKERPLSLKRIMLAFQFAIAILLIGSAIIAYNQFEYVLHKNLGMQGEQVVAIPGVPDQVKDKFETFRNRLSGQAGIAGVSACMEVPSREIRDAGPVLVEGVNSDPAKAPIMDIQIVDRDFASLLGLQFVAGGNFQQGRDSQPLPDLSGSLTIQDYLLNQDREYLINETAMRQLGWASADDAVGQRISWSIGNLALSPGPIRGVIRDYHQESLKNKVDPIVMVREPVWLRTFLIKVETKNVAASLEKISDTWNELFPSYPMEYDFLDDLYNNLYKGERVQVQLLFIFSGLAILIAFIGLLGLVAYALKTRTKEIAVRKVLGAGINDLVRLMSREYVMLLLIGGAVAIPVSIYSVNEWLSAFAYRVDVSPLSYVIAILSIVVLLVVTVGLQTQRAARANPAETLRDE